VLPKIIRNKFIILLCLILLGGCATMEKKRGMKVTPKYYDEISYAITENPAKLTIKCRPPSEQIMVDEYAVFINNEITFNLKKHSDNEIFLDPGDYSISFKGIPSGMKGIYGNYFGKPSTIQIELKENDYRIIEYTGPYWMWSKGKVNIEL